MAIDLGISGRSAIICGSSSGLGLACAHSLARAGVAVTLNGRDPEKLQAAAAKLEVETGAQAKWVAADVATEDGRKRLIGETPAPDILVNNAGGPPPGNILDFDEADWMAAFRTNMLAAVLLCKALVPGMIERRWGRVINITSSGVKMPLASLSLSTGIRTGLIAYSAALARDVAAKGVTVNNMLPGLFETERLRSYAGKLGAAKSKTAEEQLAEMAKASPAGRIGKPEEFGDWCAFLASRQGGYITGQNLLLDGGAYPGIF